MLRLLPEPITIDDLPEILRPYHQGLHKPAVSVFSSSVAHYLETAWRWHAALQNLQQIEEPALTVGKTEYIRHYDRPHSSVELVVDAARHIDPGSETDALPSAWIELICENSV